MIYMIYICMIYMIYIYICDIHVHLMNRGTVEKLVEVPQVAFVDKFVEVPQVQVQEVLRHVPKLEVHEAEELDLH